MLTYDQSAADENQQTAENRLEGFNLFTAVSFV